MKKEFQYDCVNPYSVDELNYIIDNSKEITYSTFRNNVNMEYIKEFNNIIGIPISKDWHVTFFKSHTEEGKTVYFFSHSGIEHIFY